MTGEEDDQAPVEVPTLAVEPTSLTSKANASPNESENQKDDKDHPEHAHGFVFYSTTAIEHLPTSTLRLGGVAQYSQAIIDGVSSIGTRHGRSVRLCNSVSWTRCRSSPEQLLTSPPFFVRGKSCPACASRRGDSRRRPSGRPLSPAVFSRTTTSFRPSAIYFLLSVPTDFICKKGKCDQGVSSS